VSVLPPDAHHPDLSRNRNVKRLGVLEAAKRHLLFSLLCWGLPVDPKGDDEPSGLAFDFLESLPGAPPVMTGHADGLITINVAEADDDYREQNAKRCRSRTGRSWDTCATRSATTTGTSSSTAQSGCHDSASCSATIRRTTGRRCSGTTSRAASRLAESVHQQLRVHAPVEDWAETWAHYMHMRSTLQTAASYDIDISHVRLNTRPFTSEVLYPHQAARDSKEFLIWVNGWIILTAVLNETARSMGQPDIYPFVLNGPVVTKLHFIQCLMDECAAEGHVQRTNRRRVRARRRFERRTFHTR